MKRDEYRQQILESRERNSKVFHKLISRQKGKTTDFMTERNVVQQAFKDVTETEKAINSLNKGKATDIYGLTVEHFLFGGE